MKKIASLLAVGMMVLLSGCTPPPPNPPAPTPEPLVFGVPESDWKTLSPKQKDKAIDAYNEQQQASIQAYNQQQQQNAQNAELQSVVDVASNVLNGAINKGSS